MPAQHTPNRTCLTCGKTFHAFPSHIARGEGRYCSLSCSAKARTGPQHGSWKGGQTIINGYVFVYAPGHHLATTRGYAPEHRLVMERIIGRPLLPEEVVHHIDRNRLNNLPDNLQLMSQSEHAAMHQAEASAVRWAHRHDACVACGTTDTPHKGHGLCDRCYHRRAVKTGA